MEIEWKNFNGDCLRFTPPPITIPFFQLTELENTSMTDYKHTLNLPQTEFSMKANLSQREPAQLQHWEKINLYEQQRELRKGCEKFILHDGPPYANGHIHIGHALNKTLKDIVVKSKSLSGFDAPYVPGWDCHGLPIELNVEKALGKAGNNISPKVFREKCREYANSQVNIQREEFKRLGILGDWDNPYLTMDYEYEANIIRALAKIIERGHLQQGFIPVHWCMDCRSSLAEAEVEYKDKESPAIDVRFTVLDEAAFLARLNHSPNGVGQGEISIPIWTTTPWTLPANQAVAVNPNLEYALVECEYDHKHERFFLAEALIKDVMARYEIEHYRVVAYGQGKDVEGIRVQHPFYEREVPIVLGDHVTTETGTGNVHIAPGHGQDDYVIGIRYHLLIDNPVNDAGCFIAGTPLFAGEHVLKANEHIIEELSIHGKLIHAERITHSYPHCWRHKTPVIFRATPQWFISMEKNGLRRDAMEAIFNVTWIPDWGQARIAGMVEKRPDWCISRQRYWGTPLTIFFHKETGEIHPNTVEFMQKIAERVAQRGIEAWHDLKIEEILGADAENYQKAKDTLDVWFDSGVSFSCVLERRHELAFPADIYLEGSDQHRGWFQTSLLSAVAKEGKAPYRQVLTHGFTVDAQGRKMSKSLGNVIAPEKIINTLGADILRLWVSATDYRQELSISDEILKRISDTYRRIRNTARFLLANLFDFDPAIHKIESHQLIALDRWIIERTHQFQHEIRQAYDDYQFHTIYQKIHHFCSVELGGFYLDVIKDRQYTTKKQSLARLSCQTAIYYIVEALVRWMAPILSFTAEEIWQHMPGGRENSVFLTTWFCDFPKNLSQEIFNQDFWQQVLIVREQVNKALEAHRNAGLIGSALEADVILFCDEPLFNVLQHLGNELRFVLITSSATLKLSRDKLSDAEKTDLPELWLKISASSAEKCVRCWHRVTSVGKSAAHPELCDRCESNVAGEGEVRLYA